jgi:hypothetical protein
MRVSAILLSLFVLLGNATAQQEVLLIQRTWANNPSDESSDCLLVESDGNYHFEHTPLDLGQPSRRQIHVGKLGDAEMKELQQMLADPALQSLTTPKPGKGFMSSDFDFLTVTINRGSDRQLLFFESAAGPSKSAAGNNPPSVNQTPAIKPLANWYKQISKRKDPIDKTATPKCSLEIRRR